MTQKTFTVHVPATTSNIGPGFDCIGLALNLWNEAIFSFETEGISISIQGYTSSTATAPENNLIYKTFVDFCQQNGKTPPRDLQIECNNRIPMGSGLGSSATAILTGLLAADTWLGTGLTKTELFNIAAKIEGHPDNSAPAIYGGLIGIGMDEDSICEQNFPIAAWNTVIVVPHIDLPTKVARKILPEKVLLKDAIFNVGHAILVMHALENGDENLLHFAMRDRLHQPYRIPLITGSDAIIKAAEDAGAAAAGLSGAGPGIIAFTMSETDYILSKMKETLEIYHLEAECFTPKISLSGAYISFQ
ncbi:MAG: homoserine kinase [Flexilinea sp.]